MGNLFSNEKNNKFLLHHFLPNENKLYFFDVGKESFHALPVFYKGRPFFYGKFKSINCPELNMIIFIGGKRLPENIPFFYNKRD
mgnify:CR=1 FL=1